MKLELLVEEQTPQAVVEHLVEGIQKLIPVINDANVRRYVISERNVYTRQEVEKAVERKMRHMRKEDNWRGNEGPMIILKGIDAVVMPPLTSVGLGQRLYYNLTQLLVSPQKDGGFMLVGTHERWFSYLARYNERTSQIWPAFLAGTGLNSGTLGVWSWKHKGGVVSIAEKCAQSNVLRAAHELGHGLGLEHHSDCIMQADATHYMRQRQREFCEPCRDVVSGVVGK